MSNPIRRPNFIHKPRTAQSWSHAHLRPAPGQPDRLEVGFGTIVEHEKTMTESRFFRFAYADATEESLMDAYGLVIEQTAEELARIGFGAKAVESAKAKMKRQAMYRVFWACESSQDTAIYAA